MKSKPQDAKKQPEYVEGPEAFRRFDDMMAALVAVPKEVVEKREKEYRAQVDANPNRRGPKRKA
jgi:predicted DNA-binding WGR domain protein